MSPPWPQRTIGSARRLEGWLWMGPVGHFVGGALDFLAALARYQLAQARGRGLR